MKILSVSDLCERWTYTRAGIYKLVKTAKFPEPIGVVNRGKTKVFNADDIKAYEQDKPWLFDEDQKQHLK
jgi:predicted DNA-binding transcriptional regulator AlpA